MNRGRPPKVNIDVKKSIVDLYFVEVAGLDRSALYKRGLYTRLAEYAGQKGLRLVDTDFSKCEELRSYIEQKLVEQEKALSSEGAFVPLDIAGLLNASRKDLQIILADRDRYYEDIFVRARSALSTFQKKEKMIEELRRKMAEEQEEDERIRKELTDRKTELKEKTRECSELKKYIKTVVEPCLLEEFEKKTAGEGKLLEFAQQNIRDHIRQDDSESEKILKLFEI